MGINMETINVYVTDYGEEVLPEPLGDYIQCVKIACRGDGRLIGVKRARLEMIDIDDAINTLARIAFDIDVPLTKLLGE